MKVLILALLLSVSLGAQEPKTVSIPTILTYRQELGLSDKQVEAIKKDVEQFRQQALSLSERIKQTQTQLENELGARAELPVVKQRLQAYYDARCALHFADLAMGRKLEGVLSPEQLKQWRALQRQAHSQPKAQLQPKAP